ncbi:MAG TPA: glyoxylate/hydroxypyruvate reductase A, partial [Salinimicrobium sp.]|nr:glyoxylate/hydroxypyruvate reductase A [Salinimicrobium sp.]
MSMIIISARDPQPWIQALKNKDPELDLQVYPEISEPEKVEFALVWNHPKGIFQKFPNLKVIASMGAGVDHILSDPELPKNIKITRIVDPQLASDMAEFVLALVMN